jgi:hypothetical protein
VRPSPQIEVASMIIFEYIRVNIKWFESYAGKMFNIKVSCDDVQD